MTPFLDLTGFRNRPLPPKPLKRRNEHEWLWALAGIILSFIVFILGSLITK